MAKIVILFCAIVSICYCYSQKGRDASQVIPGCYIVEFKNPSSFSAATMTAQASITQSISSIGTIKSTFTNVMNGFSFCAKEGKVNISQLSSHAEVKRIEQDQRVRISADSINTSSNSWGLDRIDTRRWTNMNSRYTYQNPVTVYVLDSGININHDEFSGNRAVYGYNFNDGNSDASDCNGHGTHVAGTIGGRNFGVCKVAKLVAVKVTDCFGSGDVSGIISAIDWVISKKDASTPSVISMSLGSGFSLAWNQAVQRAVAKNIVVVVSAGNDDYGACDYSPASALNAITVGAVNATDHRSWYSNFGPCVDIFAPGDSIRSASHSSKSGNVSFSGTSMAAPHVTGVVASYLSLNPSATPAQVFQMLNTTATLNSLSSIPASTPNRMLYSRFDLSTSGRDITNAGDWMKAFTKRRTGSLTLGGSDSYFTPSFTVGVGKFIKGYLVPPGEGCDMDLYLYRQVNSVWTELTSSYSYSSVEYVQFKTTASSSSYRMEVFVYDRTNATCAFTLLSNY